ncbi:L,D-transpeptidase family protein [Telluribacter sp. SYSU D00476]|uniref:L,D-transpeptidase family protein n=1 Tax=Telluribacter sp. SYSU D00476 TaxID=2811430 RepID=UPI001FF61F70|nr:L,D-transpeptidase family protein [Telluribacter sp. SYSU D00476]
MTKALLTLSFISILIVSPVLAQSRTGFSSIGGPSQATYRQHITRQVLSYADSMGVDVSSLRVPVGSDTLYSLLHQLRYGQRPRYLSHLALTERIDSAGIQRVLNLLLVPGSASIQQALSEFIPIPNKYLQLLSHYQRLRREDKADSVAALQTTLNHYRWIQRFTDAPFVLVNVPAAELFVVNPQGEELLRMRVIVGKKGSQTPFMATYCSTITLYPYWNVPRSIALGEMLPRIKKDPGYLERNKLQVIDQEGREVAPAKINWAAMNSKTFTYRFRQSTGCDNALGVVKFNLENPFSIYLHDTNARGLFAQKNRWLSHGCIRLQKPAELANLMLEKTYIDNDFLNKCLIDAKPGTLKLPRPFPVFILYQTVDLDQQGNLRWHPNVYDWIL